MRARLHLIHGPLKRATKDQEKAAKRDHQTDFLHVRMHEGNPSLFAKPVGFTFDAATSPNCGDERLDC